MPIVYSLEDVDKVALELLRKNKELLVKILSGDFNDNVIIDQYKAENYKRERGPGRAAGGFGRMY